MARKINTSRFYYEWKGHVISDLTAFHATTVKLRPGKPIIYLAGDSSLDNKYWVPSSGPIGEPLPVEVPEIYQAALEEPRPKPDIAFWLNHYFDHEATTINCAVEASTLKDREGELLDHDKFIRDKITTNDILIVSVGGNDIVLKPTAVTSRNLLQLAWLTPQNSLQNGTAWSLSHFVDIFKNQTELYISRLIEKHKPRAVIVCVIYFPLEEIASTQSSWADTPLKLLGYNTFPGQLQAAIRGIYKVATSKVQIDGVEVIPCALFEAMNSQDENDYTARVEPSTEGGRKMAVQFQRIIELLKPVAQHGAVGGAS